MEPKDVASPIRHRTHPPLLFFKNTVLQIAPNLQEITQTEKRF